MCPTQGMSFDFTNFRGIIFSLSKFKKFEKKQAAYNNIICVFILLKITHISDQCPVPWLLRPSMVLWLIGHGFEAVALQEKVFVINSFFVFLTFVCLIYGK